MSLVAVLGDVATTTTLALAAAWPIESESAGTDDAGDELVVLEADPTGGSLAAWLDLPASPTLSTVVTRAGDGGWPLVAAMAHHTAAGVRVVPCPPRSVEASRAVAEADRWLLTLLAGPDRPVVLADAGRPTPAFGPPSVLRQADVAVVVHRQARQSARAAAVRLERLAELVDVVSATACPWVLAVVGDTPFDPAEICRFVAGADGPDGSLPPLVTLADDPLAAAVLAGRSGVSARRLARLPLMRSAVLLASATSILLRTTREVGHRQFGHRQNGHRQNGHRQNGQRQNGHRQSGHRQVGP